MNIIILRTLEIQDNMLVDMNTTVLKNCFILRSYVIVTGSVIAKNLIKKIVL